MDDEKGNAAQVDPESFFTDETQEQSPQQQPQPAENGEANGETPTEEVWDGSKWTFKAAGKMWTPKSRDELLKYASLGINYDTKARALNQQKAELIKLKKELEESKTKGNEEEEIDVSSLVNTSDPVMKRIEQLEQKLSAADKYIMEHETSDMDAILDSGLEALNKEANLTPEETDELLLELQDRLPSLSDSAVDTPEKLTRIIRNIYYELHPDKLDEIIEQRASKKADEIKKGISSKIKVEGGNPGSPTGKPVPKDFLEASRMVENVWDNLDK
jgi:hypothetical protein